MKELLLLSIFLVISHQQVYYPHVIGFPWVVSYPRQTQQFVFGNEDSRNMVIFWCSYALHSDYCIQMRVRLFARIKDISRFSRAYPNH